MRDQITSRPDERFAIPLDEAWYCESCRVVLNGSTCFCCASAEHIHRLAPWLDHEREPISIPLTGVILSVIPVPKKFPRPANSSLPPKRLPRATCA
jgi:hypothetical protein